jgi:hypothetical protein
MFTSPTCPISATLTVVKGSRRTGRPPRWGMFLANGDPVGKWPMDCEHHCASFPPLAKPRSLQPCSATPLNGNRTTHISGCSNNGALKGIDPNRNNWLVLEPECCAGSAYLATQRFRQLVNATQLMP